LILNFLTGARQHFDPFVLYAEDLAIDSRTQSQRQAQYLERGQKGHAFEQLLVGFTCKEASGTCSQHGPYHASTELSR